MVSYTEEQTYIDTVCKHIENSMPTNIKFYTKIIRYSLIYQIDSKLKV